jgi:competence protein ComEA
MKKHWRNLGILLLVGGMAISIFSQYKNRESDSLEPYMGASQIFPKSGPFHLVLGKKIPLNEASSEDLAHLDGLGQERAENIIQWRNAHGSFRSLEELLFVPGIGKTTFKKIQPYLTLEFSKKTSNF